MDGGQVVSLPMLRTYKALDQADTTVSLRASGPGTVLSLPNVTNVIGNARRNGYLRIEALDGGRVDLASVLGMTQPYDGADPGAPGASRCWPTARTASWTCPASPRSRTSPPPPVPASKPATAAHPTGWWPRPRVAPDHAGRHRTGHAARLVGVENVRGRPSGFARPIQARGAGPPLT